MAEPFMKRATIENYQRWFKEEYPVYAELGFTKYEAVILSKLSLNNELLEEVVNGLDEINERLDAETGNDSRDDDFKDKQ